MLSLDTNQKLPLLVNTINYQHMKEKEKYTIFATVGDSSFVSLNYKSGHLPCKTCQCQV